ncbi:MAG: hypothetical protein LBL24_08385 [Bacteroidales bacterium]|jgi:hypothetical protein|nr:hypothetical protein [Bacteroidales bacterium]
MTDFIVSFGIPLAYFALFVAVVAAIIFPCMQMAQDAKGAKSALVGIGALVVVFLLCYVASESKEFTIGSNQMTGGEMKLIEAGLYLFYVSLVGSILAILYSTVSRYFK